MTGLIIDDMAVRASSPVLIGRSGEFGRLRAALELARDGRSSAILIAGEAGVGKTRLVAEFVELAQAEGAAVLLGGCIDLGDGASPYAPLVEALRGYARRADAEELDVVIGGGRSELARLVPDLGPVSDESGSSLSVGSGQGRLFELLLGVIERLGARAPVAFIVEDLHWSDRSTRDLLAFLVRNLRDAAVVLVFTYRSDELHRRHPLLPFLAELERSGRVERLELQPFDRAESAAQLRAIAGHDLDASLIESIHARSGGNAFFAEELLIAAGADGRTELPQTLRDVLLARVADLAEPTQEFLRVASATGQRVDPALLAAATDMDQAALYDALRECVGRQVLVPDPTAGTERYAFRHALVQEAIYDDLLPGERNRLHSAFARTLEATAAGDASHAAELAYHWYAAHDLPRALESSVAAGIAAEAGYAFPEALVQYERALDLWDHVPDAETRAGRDRIDLLAALAGVARFQEPARAVTHIQTAIRLADEAGNPVRSGLLNERLGRYAWMAGQGELAQRAYRTAMRVIPPEPPSEARARAVAGLAQIIMLGGRFAESRVLAEEALTLARAVGAREIEGHALNTRGTTRGVAGEVDAGIDDLRAALAIAEEVGIVDDIGRAYANWVWVLDNAERLDEAVEVAEAGIEITERLGLMRFFGTHLLCNAADYCYRLGRWDSSERALRRADSVAPFGVNEILAEELFARLAIARGHFDEAADRLKPLARLAERAADIQFVGPVQASLAELALWQGRPDDAAAQVAEGLRIIDFTPEVRIGEVYALGLRANADVAEFARARRTPDREATAVAAGEELLEGIRRRHADVVATRPAFEPQSSAWLLLCEAESARLHRQAEPDAWVACVDAWTRLGRPYVVAYVRWREAEARLAARGDRGRVAAALRAARDTAQDLGAEPLAREIAALATRARLALEADEPEESPTAPDEGAQLGLTPREREVLGLVALGRTNRQIADELFISENTAGVHVSNILGKLNVASRGEAAALAYRLGLVEATSEPA
jgi:DNA-binding NarL/FixJ family response regulator/tetratricopeptide (TPR) repeat protein